MVFSQGFRLLNFAGQKKKVTGDTKVITPRKEAGAFVQYPQGNAKHVL